MTTLVAIAYPGEATAAKAADQARRLTGEVVSGIDSIAVLRRDREGKFHVTTSHQEPTSGGNWGMLWEPLFGVLFFVPNFGMEVGNSLGGLMRAVEETDIDGEFRDGVRDIVQPGTSALFLLTDKTPSDDVIEQLSQRGGIVMTSSLSARSEAALQKELHGTATGQ